MNDRSFAKYEIQPDPEQAWFWSDRWQAMEKEAQQDIELGRVHRYAHVEQAIQALEDGEDIELD
jgi:hypothetical protein